MARPPVIAHEKLSSARHEAAQLRAEWLLNIHSELLDVNDLLHESVTPQGKPLLRLRLRQVLLSRPGRGRTRTDFIINRVAAVSGSKLEASKATVAWLLDPRTGGRRFAAWLDAQELKSGPPWPGFPFAGGSHV